MSNVFVLGVTGVSFFNSILALVLSSIFFVYLSCHAVFCINSFLISFIAFEEATVSAKSKTPTLFLNGSNNLKTSAPSETAFLKSVASLELKL